MTAQAASRLNGTEAGQIFGCGECGYDNVVKANFGGREKSLPFSYRMIEILVKTGHAVTSLIFPVIDKS